MERTIEESRARFARSLVGRWSTAQGTADMLMGQHWEIRPDGTGRFVDTGPFGHPRGETRFEWRQADAFVFELRVTAYVGDDDAQPEDEDEDEDEDEPWRIIRYDFIEVHTDVGLQIGLVDVAQVGRELCGFLESFAPLAYRGPIADAVGPTP
jgi:hypothetical protein